MAIDPSVARPPDRYFPLIDRLRGGLTILVLIGHFQPPYRFSVGFFADILPWWFLRRLVTNPHYAMLAYFVISGFLITWGVQERFGELRSVSLRKFYAFRFARIFPNLALMVALVLALAGAGLTRFQNGPGAPSMFVAVASIFTFCHNLIVEKYGLFNDCLNRCWSLSVEEVFYVLFPLLCLVFRRQAALIAFLGLFIVFAPVYRGWHAQDPNIYDAYFNYFACFDGIAIGCIAAIARRNLPLPAWAPRLALPVLLGMAFVFFYEKAWSNIVVGFTAFNLLTGALMLVMGGTSAERRVRRFGLSWLGRRCYEMYLFHGVVLGFMLTWRPWYLVGYFEKPVLFVLLVVISMGVCELVGRYFSDPLNRKLRRWLAGA